MSNESKPQEWFYLQNDAWNGPFKTSGLKELVKKGIVDPSTLLRIGITGVPIKAHQIKSLFPNYQGNKQPLLDIQKNESNHRWYEFGKWHYSVNEKIALGLLSLILIVAGLTINIFEKMSKHVPKLSPEEGIASIEKEMVMLPAGRFIMVDQTARLRVTLTKPFLMSRYEVTQEQWKTFMEYNPSCTTGAKLPVTDISWNDCQEFIKKLNASTKGNYRLPTEAEWEYACRAGTTTVYSFGDSLTKSDANIESGSIKPVGSYKPNAFGLYDMHGNVWELCNDWYGLLQDDQMTDPKGPETGNYDHDHVLRGGSCFNNGSEAGSSFRIKERSRSWHVGDNGFRLARTP